MSLVDQYNGWREEMDAKLKVSMEDDLMEKSTELVEASLEINRMYVKTLVKSHKTTIQYKRRYQAVFKELKINDGVNWSTAKEIESQIWRDDEYCRLHQEKSDQDAVLSGIERLAEIARSNKFVLNQMIKYQMHQNGYA